jgi:hypothetical protein
MEETGSDLGFLFFWPVSCSRNQKTKSDPPPPADMALHSPLVQAR